MPSPPYSLGPLLGTGKSSSVYLSQSLTDPSLLLAIKRIMLPTMQHQTRYLHSNPVRQCMQRKMDARSPIVGSVAS